MANPATNITLPTARAQNVSELSAVISIPIAVRGTVHHLACTPGELQIAPLRALTVDHLLA